MTDLKSSRQSHKQSDEKQEPIGHSRFPALQIAWFCFELSLAPGDIFLAMIGRCDFSGFDFTTFNRKAL